MKRKCGTCKYFEDRGVASSGACQHAQRRELRDVVLVRQSELACRNSWDQDLWEPSLEAGFDQVDNHAIETDEVIADTVLARRKHDEIFGGSEDVPMLSPYGTRADRVTGVEYGGFEQAEQTVAGRADVARNIRPSVLEHMRQREDERKLQRQKRQAHDLEAIEKRMGSREAHDAPLLASSFRDGSETPGVERGSSDLQRQRSVKTSEADAPDKARSLTTSGFSTRSTGLHGSIRIDDPKPPPGHQPTEQLPTAEVRETLGAPLQSVTMDEPVIHIDGGAYGNAPAVGRVPVSQKLVQPTTRDPIDQHERLRAIKRCCATCRDFRQVGDSGRGQCVNPYAFSERRMVQSDQVTCRSSLGMWWMPNDDLWLESADTSHHGRPTPLLDAAVRAQRAGESGRESRP